MSLTHQELTGALARTLSTLESLTGNTPDAALDFRTGPGEWSSREILAHLVDDEMFVMRTRLERIIKEERPELAPHDQEKWYASRNTSRDQLSELLHDFAIQRKASLNILALLRESDWQRQGHQPEYGWFSAREWLTHWVEHDTAHLEQIKNNLAAYQQNGPPSLN